MLTVRNLAVTFPMRGGRFAAVDGISFDLGPGEVLGIVGESGSGKSVTALSILRLIEPPGRIERGAIIFEDRDLLSEREEHLRKVRGKRIAMIFQDPMTSLNPVFTIGDQIGETLREHDGLNVRDARARALELLQRVGIPAATKRMDEYPHQLSGGMRQRAMIAMALACRPQLLIADEPTTALDVTIQAQILDLLEQLRRETGMAIILITHDLGVVARVAERVLVLYAGRAAEEASVRALFAQPGHPYTRGLLGSVPRVSVENDELSPIEGTVPAVDAIPPGCRFRPRCSIARSPCDEAPPPLISIGREQAAACIAHNGYVPVQDGDPHAVR